MKGGFVNKEINSVLKFPFYFCFIQLKYSDNLKCFQTTKFLENNAADPDNTFIRFYLS